MAADAIHGNNGKLFRKTSTVTFFDDFVQLCEKANNNIKTIVLDLPFIYPISKKARTRSSAKVKMPLMGSIVEVQFKKGSNILHCKESFLEERYTTANFLHPSFLKKGGLKTFPTPSTEDRGITQSKRGNIVNMLIGVLIFGQVNFCPSIEGSILMRYSLLHIVFFRVIFVLIFAHE